MRKIIKFNENWQFKKGVEQGVDALLADGEMVNLPHTWNAVDGQDGGNDYYRGACVYVKQINKAEFPEGQRYYLEINVANSSATVYLNGEYIASHDGGYSTWRVDLTDKLGDQNILSIVVDNSPNDRVYPQMADFTFYGGLYRDGNIICVP